MQKISGGASEYNAQLEKRGEISFVPKGNSMWPFIKSGKQTVIVGLKKERLKEFDVAFYSVNGIAVLHRVIEVYKDGYKTLGDGNVQEEFVKEEDVFGVLKGFYKGDKFIPSDDKAYLKKVKKWHSRKTLRKIKIKIFHLLNGKKNV